MLSADHIEGYLSRADNLIPSNDGYLETRRGANQICSGRIGGAIDWGDRKVLVRDGRIVVWTGGGDTYPDFYDVGPAGIVFDGTSFTALIGDGVREDRFYVADGVTPLWYIRFVPGEAEPFEKVSFSNEILDDQSVPYALPIARTVCTYKGHIFASIGNNRMVHSNYDRPGEFDPLNSIEFQGSDSDSIVGCFNHKESLIVGMKKSVWLLSGDSVFNFKRTPMFNRGIVSKDAIASINDDVFILSHGGVFSLMRGANITGENISGDMGGHFHSVGSGCLASDRSRSLLFVLCGGRLLVLNIKSGKWGEISNVSASFLHYSDDRIGWFGLDGLWMTDSSAELDRREDGTEVEILSRYETWPVQPNKEGLGHALLSRVMIRCSGRRESQAIYSCTVDGKSIEPQFFDVSDEPSKKLVDANSPFIGELNNVWPRPKRVDLNVFIRGQHFEHLISSFWPLRVYDFVPTY